ncbi:MAG: alcohol dehydrogenase catalytic domain-containing protein [Actinobacteria bacterium]|jgi:threonine dehydrogenase-like Zn-dependent dehydrogenase|nr:alcohol dehydrogenase catalytic domain-containing protein [Actinomycetota bacterium]
MRAALYENKGVFTLVERPIPQAGPGEAVVKIELCGICGTDLHIYLEGAFPPGFVPGHENVGTVFQLGEGVQGFQVGDRVAAGPPGSCGRCYYCIHGRPSLCVTAMSETNGLSRDGGFAEYMLVKDPRQMLYPIPDSVSFEDAVLTDTVATALRGIIQSAFKMGDNVVVSGCGPIGLSAVQLVKLGGARHVTALEVVKEKRDLAARLGADLVSDPAADGDALPDRIRDLYNGVGADLVLECAGVAQSLELCFKLARAGGQVLNLGAGGKPVSVVPALLAVREIGLASSLAYTADEAKLALSYLADGRFRTDGMLSDIIPLADIVEKGLERLMADRSLVKVAVAP